VCFRYRSYFLVLSLAVALAALPFGHPAVIVGEEPAASEPKSPSEGDSALLPTGAIARCGAVNPVEDAFISAFTFLGDGKTLALAVTARGRKDGRVTFFDATTGKEIRHVDGHCSTIIAPNGKLTASRTGATEKVIRIVDLATDKEISRVSSKVTANGPTWFGNSYRFSPDGKFIAVGGGTGYNNFDQDPPLTLWEVATGKEVRDFPLRVTLTESSKSKDT